VVEIHGLQFQNPPENYANFMIAGIFCTRDNERVWAIFPDKEVLTMPNAGNLIDAGSELLIAGIQRRLEKQD
jgi:hypothetical protein